MPESLDAAKAKVYQAAFVPAFFSKLAQAGVSPQTEVEAAALLRIGHALFGMDARETTKQAAARGDVFSRVASLVEQDAGSQPATRDVAADDAFAKRAAQSLLADPTVAAAVAALTTAS